MPDDVRSLYRRWRSRTFGELIGQDHVTSTLLGALTTGRVAHAYLFAGPRGCGKTSTARILAKAVNCLTSGGRGEPCNTCEMCTAISEGRALDLIEIDAASNRGIDEIRDLRDKVNYAPTLARYKVYILDEVHMLTNEAFNALLKTLEEPPAHVIFALVTTEAHRIPPTILSRCQRFDFHRASTKDLLAKLNHICTEEGIKVEPAALAVIAHSATGSYRDAESLLDQLASFTGDQGVTLTYVQQVLGLAPLDAAKTVVECIARKDATAGLQVLTTIMQGGTDLRQFARALVDYLRDLLLLRTNNDALIDATGEAIADMKPLADQFTVAELARIIKLFSDPAVSSGLRASAQPQLPLELAFLEACHPEPPRPHQAALSPATAPAVRPAATSVSTPAQAQPSVRPASATPAAPPAQRSAPAPARPASATYGPAPTSSAPPAAAKPAAPRTRNQVTVTAPPGTPLAQVQESWAQLLDAVKSVSRSVEAFLKECRPVEADAENIVLAFNYPFHRDSVDNPKNRQLVEESLSKALARQVHIRCTLASKDDAVASSPAVLKDAASPATEDPVVKMAQEVFGAKVVGVDKLDKQS